MNARNGLYDTYFSTKTVGSPKWLEFEALSDVRGEPGDNWNTIYHTGFQTEQLKQHCVTQPLPSSHYQQVMAWHSHTLRIHVVTPVISIDDRCWAETQQLWDDLPRRTLEWRSANERSNDREKSHHYGWQLESYDVRIHLGAVVLVDRSLDWLIHKLSQRP